MLKITEKEQRMKAHEESLPNGMKWVCMIDHEYPDFNLHLMEDGEYLATIETNDLGWYWVLHTEKSPGWINGINNTVEEAKEEIMRIVMAGGHL